MCPSSVHQVMLRLPGSRLTASTCWGIFPAHRGSRRRLMEWGRGRCAPELHVGFETATTRPRHLLLCQPNPAEPIQNGGEQAEEGLEPPHVLDYPDDLEVQLVHVV